MIVIPMAAYAGLTLVISLAVLVLYKTQKLPPISPALKTVFTEYITHITVAWVILISVLSLIVFITVRALTGKMFKTIVKPLDVLSNAAREIENNNLQYRIQYDGADEFKNVCNAFNKMSEQLCRMITERVRAEESRRELIAGLSHDLRTPLTAIKVHIEGLEIGVAANPEQQAKYFSVIKNKTDDMEYIINRLILFSKLDMEDFPVNLQTVNLHETLSKIVNDLGDEYARKSLHIAYAKTDKLLFVAIDTVLFRNVVVNILENSIQYGDKEQVELRIQTKHSGGTVEIILSDNGPGVMPEELIRLFDVFYRTDPARNTKGSGLGLAISAKIIRRMNGAIHAETAEGDPQGGGLAIIIRLPVAECQNGA
jgi:signal transduction histidine kinase